MSHLVSSHTCSVPLLFPAQAVTPNSLSAPAMSHPMKCLVTGCLGARGRNDPCLLAQGFTKQDATAPPRVTKRKQKNKTIDWNLYFPERTAALC